MRSAALASLVVALASAIPAVAEGSAVETNDHLALSFDAQGRIDAVAIDGAALPTLGAGGFFVSEVTASDTPLPMNGATRTGTPLVGVVTRTAENEVTVNAELASEGLRFTGVVTGGAALHVRGHLESARPTDRAFVVYFRVPVDATGFSWSTALERTKTLAAGDRAYDAFTWFQNYRTTTSSSPIATLASAAQNAGLALAVPPTAPAIYRLSWQQPFGFQVEWEVGTAGEPTRFPNAANVEALLYRIDARSPYRSALKRLYLMHPQLYAKRAKDGSWAYATGAQLAAMNEPEDFALRFAETYDWATSATKAHGIYAMKYTEPWNDHLETDPTGLAGWATDSASNQVWSAISKGEPRQVTAQAALLSATVGRDGKYGGYSDAANFTDAEGTHRYVLNPDAELPNFLSFTANATELKQVLNRGRAVEEYELFRQWGQLPSSGNGYDGLYLDSANTTGAGWAGWHLFNFRREHFASTKAGLVFDPQSGKVALSQALSSLSAMQRLSGAIHERGGLVMANGKNDPFIFTTAALCDFVSPGEQWESSLDVHRGLRAALATKPSSFIFNGQVTDAQFQHALLYAVFPGGAGVEGNRAAFRRWTPLMLEVGAAGWEPLTFARSDDAGVLLERYGSLDRGSLHFVAHRESGSTATTHVLLDKKALGIGPGVVLAAVDKVTGAAVPLVDQVEVIELTLSLAKESSAVIAITAMTGGVAPTEGDALPPSTTNGSGSTQNPDAGVIAEDGTRVCIPGTDCGPVANAGSDWLIPTADPAEASEDLGTPKPCGCGSANGEPGALALLLIAGFAFAFLRSPRS